MKTDTRCLLIYTYAGIISDVQIADTIDEARQIQCDHYRVPHDCHEDLIREAAETSANDVTLHQMDAVTDASLERALQTMPI